MTKDTTPPPETHPGVRERRCPWANKKGFCLAYRCYCHELVRYGEQWVLGHCGTGKQRG